jgi:hypothetical protein
LSERIASFSCNNFPVFAGTGLASLAYLALEVYNFRNFRQGIPVSFDLCFYFRMCAPSIFETAKAGIIKAL